MQMSERKLLRRDTRTAEPVRVRTRLRVPRQATQEKAETMRCNETDCHRRAHSRGYCTTHYRRWRAGQPMNAPIRRYRKRMRWRREGPFAAEYALLAELGLLGG